jgi:2'-5' RNA ligase
MRLFIAADLDAAARTIIAAEQKRLSALLEPRSSIAWVQPERMHLTMIFLGDVDESRAAALTDVMGRAVDAVSFVATLQGLGVFPPHGAPRVLWIGMTDGARELIDVQREIAARVLSVGIETESRPFHPHLTMGRWRTSRSSDRRRALEVAKPGALARVRIDAATLFHSRLSSAGPVYTALARATLTPGA